MTGAITPAVFAVSTVRFPLPDRDDQPLSNQEEWYQITTLHSEDYAVHESLPSFQN